MSIAIIITTIRYSKKLSNLVKIYINNIKYSGYNNNFTFNLAIFYNICFRVNILLKAKIKTFLIILKDPVLDNYSLNFAISNTIINFDQVYYLIKKK